MPEAPRYTDFGSGNWSSDGMFADKIGSRAVVLSKGQSDALKRFLTYPKEQIGKLDGKLETINSAIFAATFPRLIDLTNTLNGFQCDVFDPNNPACSMWVEATRIALRPTPSPQEVINKVNSNIGNLAYCLIPLALGALAFGVSRMRNGSIPEIPNPDQEKVKPRHYGADPYYGEDPNKPFPFWNDPSNDSKRLDGGARMGGGVLNNETVVKGPKSRRNKRGNTQEPLVFDEEGKILPPQMRYQGPKGPGFMRRDN